MRRIAPAGLAILLGLAGCRTALGPVRPLPADDLRPAALVAALARDADARHALRAVAQLALDGPAGSGRAKHVLVAEQPARLRVETLGFLNQTLALLVTDAGRFRLFDVRERRLHEGEVYPGLLGEVAGVALTPEDAVDVLLGAPAPPEPLRAANALLLPDGGLRADLLGEGGDLRRRVEFDPEGRLRRMEAHDEAGARWAASFDDYRALGSTSFAHEIELVFPPTATRARVSFRRVELNPELPPDVFRLRLPPEAAAGRPG